MKKRILINVAILCGILLLVFWGIYLWFINIDFVGKTQEEADASRARMEAMLLKAEYRNGTDHREIRLTDSVTAAFIAGNSRHSLLYDREYRYGNDTLFFTGAYLDKDVEPGLFEFLNAKKFVIKDSLLFMLNSRNDPDTLRPLKIRFNELH